MNMRQQMITTLEELLVTDERLVVLLADISYSLFHHDNTIFLERILNLGILEQTVISTAAGLAMEGCIPAVHSFAPFLVERPFEQLKDDFCFQQLGGNFISSGASYDYSVEGMTHHGPGDVQFCIACQECRSSFQVQRVSLTTFSEKRTRMAFQPITAYQLKAIPLLTLSVLERC